MIGHQSTTKPSRINRKLKRRWKPVKIADLVNASLTNSTMAATIAPLSQKTKVGICSLDNGHNRPLNTVVFLCPPKRTRELFLFLIIMAGFYRQTLKSLADSVIGTANLFYPATQCFAALRGGYSPFNGVTRMNISQASNTHAQNPEQNQPQDYDVTFFAVCNTAKIEGINHIDIVSPFFETRGQALEFKANSLKEYPDCFTAKYVFEYSLESDPARLELLAKIVSGSFQQA